MTIIIFLIDTSASMNQRTYLGTTLLDVAKGAVETFMKVKSNCLVLLYFQGVGSQNSCKIIFIVADTVA